jgi:uncharacterized protein involved in oxidation of intracellular sulfur
MGKILYLGTFGSDDPTRASMPFITASGALDRGHEPIIALMGEAVYVMKEEVLNSIQGVGFPPLREVVDKIVSYGVPIYL